MYVFTIVCIYVRMYVCMYVCICMHVCMSECVRMRVRVCGHGCVGNLCPHIPVAIRCVVV